MCPNVIVCMTVSSSISIMPLWHDIHPIVLFCYTKYLLFCVYVDMTLWHVMFICLDVIVSLCTAASALCPSSMTHIPLFFFVTTNISDYAYVDIFWHDALETSNNVTLFRLCNNNKAAIQRLYFLSYLISVTYV
jgi:hypothetical protein